MPDVMDTVTRCAPSAEAAERIHRVAARMAYFDGACGMLTMPEMEAQERPWCEVDGCEASAEECDCGAAHCADHPHPPEAEILYPSRQPGESVSDFELRCERFISEHGR